jgi:ABC-type transport system involved in cytochrome c biogenesis permease subunit
MGSVLGIVALALALGLVISIVWVVLDYVLIYRNLGSYSTLQNARTPAIILGILQLLFGGVIPGILLVVVYSKIGDSSESRMEGL